ncbi:MAG: hypothetical protein WBW55_10745 [Desulfobaccales bacterium]
MTKRYYSSRDKVKKLTIEDLYHRLQNLYLFFRDKDYFKEKAGITNTRFPEQFGYKIAIAIGFQPFPISEWDFFDITEDHIFDVIEVLFDHISKPGEWVSMTDDTGFNYHDYDSYDDAQGQAEFREMANIFLCDYKTGYELDKNGFILAKGTHGLQHILDAEIEPYDEVNVDRKVLDAIQKWRNRHLNISERRLAIRELADVFEWLRKSKKLDKVLKRKDEAALFEIANSFAIRHHDPKQKRDYDEAIWYSWIFHFYLATYHLVIRLLKREESGI